MRLCVYTIEQIEYVLWLSRRHFLRRTLFHIVTNSSCRLFQLFCWRYFRRFSLCFSPSLSLCLCFCVFLPKLDANVVRQWWRYNGTADVSRQATPLKLCIKREMEMCVRAARFICVSFLVSFLRLSSPPLAPFHCWQMTHTDRHTRTPETRSNWTQTVCCAHLVPSMTKWIVEFSVFLSIFVTSFCVIERLCVHNGPISENERRRKKTLFHYLRHTQTGRRPTDAFIRVCHSLAYNIE